MAIQIFPNYRKPYKGILSESDEKLRKFSKEVSKIDNTVFDVVNQLVNILRKIDRPYNPWLGMAAPQIGFNLRVIAIKRSFNNYQVMINPKFLKQKWILPTISGCYSLKGLYLLRSPYWVEVGYLDLKGRKHTETFFGGKAILLKQELDHLNGKLVCD